MPATPAPQETAYLARAVAYLVVAGMVIAAAWVYRQGFYKAMPFPKNTFVFLPTDHFNDFFNFIGPVRAEDPYSYQWSNYFPFSYLLVYPLVQLSRSQITDLYLLLVCGGVCWYLFAQLDSLRLADRLGVTFILGIFTYPMVFMIDRGNFEAFVVLLLIGFVWALLTDRRAVAIAFLGAAGAMKGVPLIFVAVFLIRRDFAAVGWTIAVAVALNVAGTVFYGFDVPHALDLLRKNLDLYREGYIIGDAGLGWSTSLWCALKVLMVDGLGADAGTVRSVLPVYEAGAALAGFGLVAALLLRPYAVWQQITLLTSATILLPEVSGDYKRLHLIIPLALFLRYGATDRWRWPYAAAFALLLVPLPYAWIRLDPPVGLSVVVAPVTLLALSVAVLLRPQGERDAAMVPSGTPASAGRVRERVA